MREIRFHCVGISSQRLTDRAPYNEVKRRRDWPMHALCGLATELCATTGMTVRVRVILNARAALEKGLHVLFAELTRVC